MVRYERRSMTRRFEYSFVTYESVAAFLLKNPFMRGTWLARRESCTHVQCRGLTHKHVGTTVLGVARARGGGRHHHTFLC